MFRSLVTVLDKKGKIQKELSTLQSELDRILYLLKIADPTGEAVKKREAKEQNPKIIIKKPAPDTVKKSAQEKIKKDDAPPQKSNTGEPDVSLVKSVEAKATLEAKPEPDTMKNEAEAASQSTSTTFAVPKPQWLGAVADVKKQETKREPAEVQESDEFVDYKNRASILSEANSTGGIEDAAPGLIIRKRKQVTEPKGSDDIDPETNTASSFKAEDAVALLLKHSRGYHAADEEDGHVSEDVPEKREKEKKGGKKKKRVLGPEKPPFLEEPDYSSWVPPKGNKFVASP